MTHWRWITTSMKALKMPWHISGKQKRPSSQGTKTSRYHPNCFSANSIAQYRMRRLVHHQPLQSGNFSIHPDSHQPPVLFAWNQKHFLFLCVVIIIVSLHRECKRKWMAYDTTTNQSINTAYSKKAGIRCQFSAIRLYISLKPNGRYRQAPCEAH